MRDAMRHHGTGTIERHGNGYRARVRLDGRRVTLGTYATEREAQSVLRGAVDLRASGAVVGAPTLRGYGKRWLDRRELAGTRSIRTDRYRWDRHVLGHELADIELGEMRSRDVRAWLDELGKTLAADKRGRRRVSWQTRRHCLNLVRACLRSAVDDELLAVNPAGAVKLPRPAGQDAGWAYLLPEQQTQLASAPASVALRLMVSVALGTGMRQGEQWALELADVHVDSDEPHLVVRYGGPNRAPTKNGRVRRVPLWGTTLEAMRAWLRVLPRFSPRNPRGLCFPSPRGCHRDKKPPRGWHELVRAAGLSLRWHDLRHTCASSLVAGWWGRRWTLDEVREVLGHTSVTVTERYAHLSPGVLATAASEAQKLAPKWPQMVPIIAQAQGSPGASGAVGRAFESPLARQRNHTGSLGGDPGPWGQSWGQFELRDLAVRYLQAVESRSRLCTRHGVELAEAVLRADESAAGGARRAAR